MKNYNHFLKIIKKKWYTQGFNAYPIFLNNAGASGFRMKKFLNYSYTCFIFNYSNGYCEMGYLEDDLAKIWRIVKSKLIANPNYLKNIYDKYKDNFHNHEVWFKKINSLSSLADEELIKYFKKCAQAMSDSVGLLHILDAIGIETEKEFKKLLHQEISDKDKFNYYFDLLSRPSKLSFIAEEEKKLMKINKLPKNKKAQTFEQHVNKYFWLQNSYAGPQKLSKLDFEKHLKILAKEKRTASFLNKKKIIKQLKPTEKVVEIINIIDSCVIWQDERKANVLKTVGYFGKIINEIGKRIKIKTKLLYYLGISDIEKIDSLNKIKFFESDLILKSKGVFFLQEKNKEFYLMGEEYKKLISLQKKISSVNGEINKELHGTIANKGTAIGRVVICKNILSLNKVKYGDILVTSMTRPEMLPAIRRAAAIITDEGGITSHAAIISRELGKPVIIGTKIATKILKDGMLVQVKANHGVVKIIK